MPNEENNDDYDHSTRALTGKKRRKKKKRRGFDLEECSEVTPIISNRRSRKNKGESSSSSNRRQSEDGIDYGQLVVDSRTSNRRDSGSLAYELPRSLSGGTVGENHNSNNEEEDSPYVSTSSTNNGSTNTPNAGDEEEGGETSVRSLSTRELSTWNLPNHNALVLNHIWLPFFVCLFSTTRFILSTTASLSCRFIKIDIGFVPRNVNFMSNDVFASPWAFHDGTRCLGYPQDFTSEYIDGNYSWKIARFAAVVNMILGSIIFFVASFVVIYRVMRLYPVATRVTSRLDSLDKRWEACVFIFIILMFIAEVLKFVFWGINLCTEDIWLTPDSNLQAARGGCALASGARCSISALAFDLATIMTLTVGSNNLRNSLSACFTDSLCCSKKEKEPENDNGELEATPRYFFEEPTEGNGANASERTNASDDAEKQEIKDEIKRDQEESDQESSRISASSGSEASKSRGARSRTSSGSDASKSVASRGSRVSRKSRANNQGPERSVIGEESGAYSDSSQSHEVQDSSDDDSTGHSVFHSIASSRIRSNSQSTASSAMIDLLDS